MLPSRIFLHSFRGPAPRRWTCALLASGYVFAAAGIPLPVTVVQQTDERYPCAASGCGCDSAEKCWNSCCCHTLAERLAWAEKNGVTPPDFALAAAREAGLDATGKRIVARVVNTNIATKTCCTKQRSCCSSQSKSCCKSSVPQKQDEKTDLIVAWRAMACHGQSLQWLAAVPTLIHVELDFSCDVAPAAWCRPLVAEFASPLSDAPITPPPERV